MNGLARPEENNSNNVASLWPEHSSGVDARGLRPLGLGAIARKLVGLPAGSVVSPSLISPRSHDTLLSRYCQRLITERLHAASILLCLVTVAWIPIDAALFDFNSRIVVPLATGRLAFSALFWMVGRIEFRPANAYHGVGSIALMVSAGLGFIFFAYVVLIEHGQGHIAAQGCEQYALMPIALIAGISIFPLSLVEALSLTILPLMVLIVGSRLCDNVFAGLRTDALVLLTSSIIGTAVTSSVSQLNLLINLLGHSTMDPLTEALSRRGGTELLDVFFRQSECTGTSLSLALFDLDRFKLINDRYGHLAGDRVLREMIRSLKVRMRRQDAVIRWGGEEFVVVMPNTDAVRAREVLMDLCFSGSTVRPDGTLQAVSAGLAERTVDKAQSWTELVNIADERMYKAKEMGRNQLVGPAPISLNREGE